MSTAARKISKSTSGLLLRARSARKLFGLIPEALNISVEILIHLSETLVNK